MRKSGAAQIVCLLRRGQVTLLVEFRRCLGIDEDSLLEIRLRNDRIEIRPMVARPAAGSGWARELYEMFAPVRDAAAAISETEVDALIDEAVEQARSARHG